jgi:photosystem II stability/assembly factor-like uncharacterized protein
VKLQKYIIFFLLLFIEHFTLKIKDCASQWFIQPWPVSGNTYDIKFFDTNTGIACLDNFNVLRTTNGGSNWYIINNFRIFKLNKINDSVIFGWGRPYLDYDRIYRTFNKGLTWDSVAITGNAYQGLSFINKDTGFISGFDGNNNRIWKTVNGGVSIVQLPGIIGKGKIFFLKYKINGEYYGWCCDDINLYKTTNSGVNWFQVGSTGHGIWQLEFINQSTGYATWGGEAILKSTDGGLTWIQQNMPNAFGVVTPQIKNFKIINNNLIYGDYGTRQFPNNSLKGIIWKSTNGGVNWGFQMPDTTNPYMAYLGLEFTDSLNGWSYNIHTTNGGGPIIYMSTNNSGELLKTFQLQQNYPNPFNNSTTIEFSILSDSYINLKIFDITGKTVLTIINGILMKVGNYKYTIDAFNTLDLSSGVFFYRLEAKDRNKNNQLFLETKKMLMIK